MKRLSTLSMGKMSMRQTYAGTKAKQHDTENMPGGETKPPTQQL